MSLDITNWKTPAAIIANIIVEKLPEVFTLGENLFIGFLPDAPDNAVCLIDSGGGLQDPVNAIDDNSFQVYSRNTSYSTGYNLQNLVKATIQSSNAIIFNDEIVLGIWVKSNIAALGKDELDRSLFSSNYRALIQTQKDSNREKDEDVFIDGGNANSF